ncbi:hypothetical protein CA850_05875 [Micromonospora echinospora]|uniref:Uncharacterized protein n=1 Tax=Micromonospora echinospora TaxID=1877 RepID=A0A1C4V2C1_MICEC|nr:hypothetical protein [Micromonospora echinospora]OZV83033.1 hypothetical protein CA850_05875 [Micromonospora echinospora]SCE78198.1 hypothetical protein GA0070618_0886 [Micromonospora echinospora]
MAEAAVVLNTTAGLTGFITGQARGLTEGLFQVTGFNDARFEKEMPLEMLASPNPLGDKQVVMVRGSQSVDHVYWLRYLRRGKVGVTDRKRVCVELLVRFTTFDYVPKAGQDLKTRHLNALADYPMWGISGLSVSLMATGRGRNPFNKFNEVGSLVFDTMPVTAGLPHFRINYRVQHQAKTVMGATLALNHNDVGAFLVHSNGLLEIAPGEGRTEKHFRITPLSGRVHDRPSRIGAASAPTGRVSLLTATKIVRSAGQDANALAAHEHANLRVIGFDQLNGPDTLTVDSANVNGVVARADPNGRQGAVRLEYIRNGGVLATQVRTKIRVLLLLRYTLVSYFTDPDQAGNRQVVQQNGVRYSSFRDVSLTVLDTVAGDPLVVGEDGTKYDIKAIKNRFHETSTLRFGARIEEVNGQVGAQVRINWRAQHAGSVGKSQSHDNHGDFRLGIDQSGNPVLRLLDEDSNKYFTVTS